MAAKKKKGGRQGVVSKVINISLIALALAPAITRAFKGRWGAIIRGYTAGLAGNPQEGVAPGKFDMKLLAEFYAPVGGAVALGFLKSYLLKKFPVRR